MSPLGSYIVRAREKLGWDRQALADKTNIPYTTLRNIERNEVTVRTSEEYLQRIAVALGVPFDELRVLAGYMVVESDTTEMANRRLAAQLDAYPELRKAVAALIERGDKAEIDRAATVLEVHRRVERDRGKR